MQRRKIPTLKPRANPKNMAQLPGSPSITPQKKAKIAKNPHTSASATPTPNTMHRIYLFIFNPLLTNV
ncbi:unnamed protein product, partial [marine sediment metagenome]